MNDEAHAAYSSYIRELADLLLLRDWELELDRSVAESDSWSQVKVSDVENFARIFIRWPEFFHQSRENRREWLVHELLHIHLDRPRRIIEQLAEQFSDNSAGAFAREAHRREIEICVQRLARLIAPHMPLPSDVAAQ